MVITDAKAEGTLKKADWDKAKGKYGLAGIKEKCCIVLIKKQGKHYMCLVDTESKSCEILIKNWVRLLNAYSSKLNFLEDQDSIKAEAAGLSCTDSRMNIMRDRIVNAAIFQN